MKALFFAFIFLSAGNILGQIPFPKGFRLVKGESTVGLDDVYTNGKYVFQTHRTGAYPDSNITKALNESFGFQFHQTKDSILWGTGRVNNGFSYVVFGGELIELSSPKNDSGFSYYSKWLLLTT